MWERLSQIIVYGSYERGDYNDYSDVDVMILVKMSEAEIKKIENEIYDLAFEIEMNTGVDISPVIKMRINMSIGRIHFHIIKI